MLALATKIAADRY